MTEHDDRPRVAPTDARARRDRLIRRALPLTLLVAALALTVALRPLPHLVWNASVSAPIGLYAVSPGAAPARGDMVIAWPPADVRALAAARRYLPADVPLVKRVAAATGDRVCARGATLSIDGRVVAARRPRDKLGRTMPWWRGCVTLRGDALLLLTDPPASFDGRYFGPTRRADIVGTARLIWQP